MYLFEKYSSLSHSYFSFGTICGRPLEITWGRGSFAVHFGDHLWPRDHLRLGIICGTAYRAGSVVILLRFISAKQASPAHVIRRVWMGLTTNDDGRKILLTTDKTRKNYRLQTGKILTDHRHGRKLSFFRKKSIFLGSKQRYRWFYKCYCKEKGKTPNISCFDGRHKSQIEGIEIVCRAYENFHKATHHSVLHITCEKCLD